jgi:BolA protein
MGVKAWILEQLSTHLHPSELEVWDESAAHRGHPGVQGAGGETHFRVRIRSEALTGLSRVAQHRRLYALLAAPPRPIHALSLEVLPPPPETGT